LACLDYKVIEVLQHISSAPLPPPDCSWAPFQRSDLAKVTFEHPRHPEKYELVVGGSFAYAVEQDPFPVRICPCQAWYEQVQVLHPAVKHVHLYMLVQGAGIYIAVGNNIFRQPLSVLTIACFFVAGPVWVFSHNYLAVFWAGRPGRGRRDICAA
jgi:hypothetical protein